MSNNRHSSCPALMSDGRIFTNYLSNRMYNDFIKFKNDIKVNTDYKEFLQANATTIIAENNQLLEKASKCPYAVPQTTFNENVHDVVPPANAPKSVVQPRDPADNDGAFPF